MDACEDYSGFIWTAPPPLSRNFCVTPPLQQNFPPPHPATLFHMDDPNLPTLFYKPNRNPVLNIVKWNNPQHPRHKTSRTNEPKIPIIWFIIKHTCTDMYVQHVILFVVFNVITVIIIYLLTFDKNILLISTAIYRWLSQNSLLLLTCYVTFMYK